jgi:uncharacterized protein with von Willebrand factor type A (vWA) domain
LRRFDYVMHISPADIKQPRRKSEGKIRTNAATIRGVAADLLGQDHPAVPHLPESPLHDEVAENRIAFDFSTPELGSVHVEMQEVAEGPVHPVTKDGFVAWAERQVRENPEVNGKPNTVEQELAAGLHQVQLERLYDHKASELLYLLSDMLLDGCRGYSQMTREELLQEIDQEIIQNLDEEDDLTVEDLFCVECE